MSPELERNDDQKNATFGEDAVVAPYHASRMHWSGSASYHRRLNEYMLKYLPQGRNLTVLDDMCGTGAMLPALNERYDTTIGVDLSARVLTYAREYGDKLAQGDATFLPFPAERFDIVVVRGGLHHVPRIEQAISEIERVLKRGGVCVFFEPREDNLLVHGIRRLIYHVSSSFNPEEEHGIKSADFASMIARARLEVTHSEPFGLLGFALFCNPDTLTFTRPFSFMPGAARLSGWMMQLDSLLNKLPLVRSFAFETLMVAQKN